MPQDSTRCLPVPRPYKCCPKEEVCVVLPCEEAGNLVCYLKNARDVASTITCTTPCFFAESEQLAEDILSDLECLIGKAVHIQDTLCECKCDDDDA